MSTTLRTLLQLTLLLGCGHAAASGWPWQGSQPQDLDYCSGLVVGGLASRAPAGGSRTDLWLAWSYLIDNGALGHMQSQDFTTGREKFAAVTNSAAAQDLLGDADGTCGLGRSNHQIVGW